MRAIPAQEGNEPHVGLEMYTVAPGLKTARKAAPKRTAPVPDIACTAAY